MTPWLSTALSSALLMHPGAAHVTTQDLPPVRVARLTIFWSEGNPGTDAAGFGEPWPFAERGLPPRGRTAPLPQAASSIEMSPSPGSWESAWSGEACLRWLARGTSAAEDLMALSGSWCPQLVGLPPQEAAARAQGFAGFPRPVETPIGSRLRYMEGISTIIQATRMDELPRPLRDQAWAMIRDPMSRGQAMFHGSFILPDVESDQIRSIIALGPGLVKEPRGGRDGSALGAARVEQAEGGRLVVGLGPFSINIPSRLRIGSSGAPLRSVTRVNVTRSRWPVDSATAVTVSGFLRDDTVITFRVTRKSMGHRRDEVLTYPSVNVGALAAPDAKPLEARSDPPDR